ncbi:hypothetical protein NQ318_013984 [Aromia moschata]|uniref:Secreted protein n=1 Tax=Aromia moschata TaxID=1265417 RepID=A0AAV8YZW8_9CUCU|nr:hypothetical protein NQ318_013984 [Aromia moschata]
MSKKTSSGTADCYVGVVLVLVSFCFVQRINAQGTAERTLILISRQTKITTCKCLECKRTAETFGHQNT